MITKVLNGMNPRRWVLLALFALFGSSVMILGVCLLVKPSERSQGASDESAGAQSELDKYIDDIYARASYANNSARVAYVLESKILELRSNEKCIELLLPLGEISRRGNKHAYQSLLMISKKHALNEVRRSAFALLSHRPSTLPK